MDKPANGPGQGTGGPTGSAEPRVDVFGKRPSSRSMTRYVKPTLWGLLLAYVVLFLLVNRAPTEVNFLFFSATAPLVIALLVIFLLGVIVGAGGLLMRDRRKAARASRAAKH